MPFEDNEDQILAKQEKHDLHEWIDGLPDGFEGVILCRFDDPDDKSMEIVRYREIGDITAAQMNWLLDTFKARILSAAVS